MITNIKENIQGKNGVIQHIYREGNKLADYVENYAIDKGNCVYEHFTSLEIEGRRIINIEKLKNPYLRVLSIKG